MYLTDYLPFAVLSADRKGLITYANGPAENLLQARFTDMRGKPVSDFIEIKASLQSHIEGCLEHGNVLKAYDQEIRLSAGGKCRANLQVAPIMHHAVGKAKPEGYALILDTIEGVEWLDRQHTQQDMTRRSALMAAMLAHEIRNPLASIRSAAQLLEDECANGKLCELVIAETDRIARTLERVDFLHESRQVTQSPVNIHEVLHYVRSVLDRRQAESIRFEERFDPTIPDIAGDRELLVQLFLNLVKNAAEALDGTQRKTIGLTTGVHHDFSLRIDGRKRVTIAVCVEDNGPGIAEEVQRNMFIPYVTTKKGGHGLGLMICAKIAADHQGVAELIESRPGRTVFRVLLPAFAGGGV